MLPGRRGRLQLTGVACGFAEQLAQLFLLKRVRAIFRCPVSEYETILPLSSTSRGLLLSDCGRSKQSGRECVILLKQQATALVSPKRLTTGKRSLVSHTNPFSAKGLRRYSWAQLAMAIGVTGTRSAL